MARERGLTALACYTFLCGRAYSYAQSMAFTKKSRGLLDAVQARGLREHLKEKRWSIREFGRRMGISAPYAWGLVKGTQRLSARMALKLTQVLDSE